MKKVIKFSDGQITVEFNKSVHVEVDVKRNKTLLEIPGIPTDYKDSKKVQVTAPTLARTNRFFIAADDHKGNSVLAMIQGKMTSDSLKNAKEITNKRFIELAQSFLNAMKKEG
ncbi:hypothetical protein FOL80_05310 [Lactobacillus reuteri]|uniref:hypothetical protein n=1 Tax=Limosilactobacillus reuteri TaxID=1598 RepID=UPI00146DDB6D|nr:hypothetical protein [Limosilactobacillus reuteri]NMV59860.1 hypothetical protein [Limosilactobacillus reuteri]NMV61677.1 hypothetical protein [Limosilactobacillus reuteri]NMV63420.1 hypothetical protein [Limosilactobacillus reuteri]